MILKKKFEVPQKQNRILNLNLIAKFLVYLGKLILINWKLNSQIFQSLLQTALDLTK